MTKLLQNKNINKNVSISGDFFELRKTDKNYQDFRRGRFIIRLDERKYERGLYELVSIRSGKSVAEVMLVEGGQLFYALP